MIFIFACMVVATLLIHISQLDKGLGKSGCFVTTAAMGMGTLVYLLVSSFDSRISELTKAYYSKGYSVLLIFTGIMFCIELIESFSADKLSDMKILILGLLSLIAIYLLT